MSDEKKSAYFDMSKALDEFNHQSFGAKDKTISGLKMFGKGLFNVARYTVAEVIPAAAEATANQVLKNEKATDEQKERAKEAKEKASAMRSQYRGESDDR